MSQPYVGQIILVGFNFAPAGWAFCQGQLLAISENETLFQLIGTTYGGDGQSTFGLPDLRGRAPVEMGVGPGLSSYLLGETFGAETMPLTQNQIPAHAPTLDTNSISAAPRCKSTAANQRTPAGNVAALEAAGVTMTYSNVADALMRDQSAVVTGNPGTVTAGSAGGNQPHNNMQPSLVMNYCISLFGIFPSPT